MDLKCPKDTWLFLAGELYLTIKKGQVDIFGAIYNQGDQIEIPKYRSAPLYTIEDSELEIQFEEDGYIAECSEPLIPEDWIQLANELSEKEKGYTVMAIGGVDTGKTGLITFLANKLVSVNKKVAIIDADTGQSDIGPPSTIGLGKIEKPIIHLSQAEFVDAFFVGNVTPAGVLDRSITGTFEMVRRAKEANFDMILIDTTGWVSDRWGRELKILKFLTVRPDMVVFIEKTREELWHLKKAMQGVYTEIRHVTAPLRLRSRSWEIRRKIRAEMFTREFDDAREVVIPLDSVGISYGFIGTGREPSEDTILFLENILGDSIPYVEESEDAIILFTDKKLPRNVLEEIKGFLGKREAINITKEDLHHLLVCFTDLYGRYLGLGVILDFDPKDRKLLVWTNARLDILSNIQFGHMKVNPNGEEEGKFEPWIV